VEDCAMSRLTVDDVIDHEEDVVVRMVDIQEIREVIPDPSNEEKITHSESVEVPWTIQAPVANQLSERDYEPRMPDPINIDVAPDSESVKEPWTAQAPVARQTSKRDNEPSKLSLDEFDSPLWPSEVEAEAETEKDVPVARFQFDMEDVPPILQVPGTWQSTQPNEVGLLSVPLSDNDSRIDTDVFVQLKNGSELIPIDSFLSIDIDSFYDGDDLYSTLFDDRPRRLTCLQNIIEELDDLSLSDDAKRAFGDYGVKIGMYNLCSMPCTSYENTFADGDTFSSRSQCTFSTVEAPHNLALLDEHKRKSHRPRRFSRKGFGTRSSGSSPSKRAQKGNRYYELRKI
jgi:hypothetical protein